MKKLLLLALLATTFASCQPKQCWQCTTSQHTEPNGPISDYQTTEQVCDKTRREIRAYEQQHSYTVTTGIVTVTQTVTCR